MKCHCGANLIRIQEDHSETLDIIYRCNRQNGWSTRKRCKSPIWYNFKLYKTEEDSYVINSAVFKEKKETRNFKGIGIACIGIVHDLIFSKNLSTDLIKMIEFGGMLS